MKISEQTIVKLGSIITGDSNISPRRTGLQLVNFFNGLGANDTYGSGFPSRWQYAEEKIREFNDTPIMKQIISAAFDPRYFIGKENEFDIVEAVEQFNQFLEFDGYVVKLINKKWEVSELADTQINLSHPYQGSQEITHLFIDEQIQKCDRKLAEGDFDGAITNARSLIEAVLKSIEQEFDTNAPEYDGNLPKLYKRVQKHLNLCPGQEALADCLRQILSGLTSVVNGLSTLRNNMSDSHVISYKPAKHHATLAVNSAKTLCNFLFDTKEYQIQKYAGSITKKVITQASVEGIIEA